MEWVLLGIFTLFFIGVFATYKADPEGFKRALGRGKKIVRANLESKKEVKAIERSKDTSKDEWMAAFTGKPVAEVEQSNLKHAIIKTGYVRGLRDEDWPSWNCKCGTSGSKSTCNGWDWAFTEARKDARNHVQIMNESEARREASKNKQFAWEI